MKSCTVYTTGLPASCPAAVSSRLWKFHNGAIVAPGRASFSDAADPGAERRKARPCHLDALHETLVGLIFVRAIVPLQEALKVTLVADLEALSGNLATDEHLDFRMATPKRDCSVSWAVKRCYRA